MNVCLVCCLSAASIFLQACSAEPLHCCYTFWINMLGFMHLKVFLALTKGLALVFVLHHSSLAFLAM